MVRTANDAAANFVHTFALRSESNGCRPPRLNRFFNAQIRNIKSMLHVSSADLECHRLPRFEPDYGGLETGFLHHNGNVLGRFIAVLAS